MCIHLFILSYLADGYWDHLFAHKDWTARGSSKVSNGRVMKISHSYRIAGSTIVAILLSLLHWSSIRQVLCTPETSFSEILSFFLRNLLRRWFPFSFFRFDERCSAPHRTSVIGDNDAHHHILTGENLYIAFSHQKKNCLSCTVFLFVK